jgi:XRE family aerobic/anaerobic benzoate catabolism transcriptional regulator
VWLAAAPDEHYRRVLAQGDRRPMQHRPRARQELEALLDRRRALYSRCALRVDTDGRAPADVAAAVLAGLERVA